MELVSGILKHRRICMLDALKDHKLNFKCNNHIRIANEQDLTSYLELVIII